MSTHEYLREYVSHPLTHKALVKSKQFPDIDYPLISNARILSSRLQSLPAIFSPGEISAIGLIGKAFLRLIELYQEKYSPRIFEDLDHFLQARLGPNASDSSIAEILSLFPTPSVYQDPASITYYLFSAGEDYKRQALLKSIILIVLAEDNPAIRFGDGVFTSPELRSSPLYQPFLSIINAYFCAQLDPFSSSDSLFDLLRSPARTHPDSILKQLNYISNNWGSILGEDFINDLLKSIDRLKEEQIHHWFGPVNTENPLGYEINASHIDLENVRFSEDLDWMPRVILLAKNVFVWMDQLSKKYQRPIHQLDHIPDQELEQLSSWGITGLWLIGIWQRSPASQKIKQLCGNPDAVPSAYSLFDYSIADTLGGETAFENLSARAKSYNIRLAADMVPNHMGITSNWVLEHPDWFLSVDQAPFPSYSFNGPDLSRDSKFSIFLEDHYYDKSDASVVCKRIDNITGEVRYIYHGNDGTSMPWNDTAQLDFLQETVREAVIQTILHVARNFPIIRFDAAMTLTKKHYQRLWFPQPGTGGAIPTRSDFGLSKSQFDKIMPAEFWREVVDRVAAEVPDTLLLAEAFWMMEGFFVRTLGMHRVYNSAFMHMLRDEDNKKYRDLIKQTLAFDPEILKRYVNFMNNPDEDTAIVQFGSDGKYFGICIMMATLPGLPMFGHGQIEGFSEKYGMEYQRAYYDEQPDYKLISRHHREVFPLLHKRYLFAEAANFVLYDFVSDSGSVNENVFVYSNRFRAETALIIYQNKWDTAQGFITRSANINGTTIDLLDGLGLNNSDASFITFREIISGLEFIRSKRELQVEGLRIILGAYQYQVLQDFKEISDPDGQYARLSSVLSGSGVSNIQEKLLEINLSPTLKTFDRLFCNAYQNFVFPYLPSWSILSGLEFDDFPVLEDHFSLYFSEFFNSIIKHIPDTSVLFEVRIDNITARLNALHLFLVKYPIKDPLYDNLVVTLLLWALLSEISDKILDKSLQKIIFLLSTMPFSGKLINTLDKDLIIRSTTLVLHPSVSF
ncbi:MAG: alpha-amylase family glycosyl hydrolase, partial [Anaerolineales bacterium]|nr:alpha-amylase family glycosyl hydrolase [Anaerolineales bacterium]